MIYAFLIHSSENVGSIFFSHFYTGEGNDQSKTSRQQTIIRKVIEDKTFQQHSASYFPTRIDLRVLSQSTINSLSTTKKVSETCNRNKGITPPLEGTVLLNSPSLFEGSLVAIWRQFNELVFTTVCDARDNLSLISNSNLHIIDSLCRKFTPQHLERRIVEQPDEVEIIISPVHRNGTPLIINHSVHRFLVKSGGPVGPYMD